LRRPLALVLALTLAACTPAIRDKLFGRHAAPASAVHYVLGQPYQVRGQWLYPREDFAYDETGLAAVAGRHPPLTTDGEPFDQSVLAAGHPTLQLPALARITNLETGRQVVVRINDRGPVVPGRSIEVTRRTAELVGANGAAPFRIRVQVLETESRQLAAALEDKAALLPIATAPRASIQAEGLPPPLGVREAAHIRTAAAGPMPRAVAASADAPPIPQRLPELVTQTQPRPGLLYIDCGAFGGLRYAEILRARIAGLGASIATSTEARPHRPYRVQIGPLSDVAQADTMLDRALLAGVTDVRIVVK
jgi:rare lipoprotein A